MFSMFTTYHRVMMGLLFYFVVYRNYQGDFEGHIILSYTISVIIVNQSSRFFILDNF